MLLPLSLRIVCAVSAVTVLMIQPAAAQPVVNELTSEETRTADDGRDILVTGDRVERRKAVEKQARDIAEYGNIHDWPLARMEDRVCPGVIGLQLEAAQLMVDRIRWNAERLGLWMDERDDCDPNIVVAFVEDGQDLVAQLREKKGYLFELLTIRERDELTNRAGPVHVWTNAAPKSRDGMPISTKPNLSSPPVVRGNAAHSRIYLPIRRDITSSLVLYDRSAVEGMTVIQLADYASMRAFAKVRPPEGHAKVDTILTLFNDPATAPKGLTDFDLAYLRSLYEWIPNLPAAAKLYNVNRHLRLVAEEAQNTTN